jgi:hypothetical protein
MQRGLKSALAIGLPLLLALLVAATFTFWSSSGWCVLRTDFGTWMGMKNLCFYAQALRTENNMNYPRGSNAQIANAFVKRGLLDRADNHSFNERGELIDRWKRPYQFIVTDTSFCIISSGEDGEFNTFDDLVYVDTAYSAP